MRSCWRRNRKSGSARCKGPSGPEYVLEIQHVSGARVRAWPSRRAASVPASAGIYAELSANWCAAAECTTMPLQPGYCHQGDRQPPAIYSSAYSLPTDYRGSASMATAPHLHSPADQPEPRRRRVGGRRCAQLTQPRAVHWCDGSDAEVRELTAKLMQERGARSPQRSRLPRLPPRPLRTRATWRASSTSPSSARSSQEDAGPNNNWMDPHEAHAKMRALFARLHEGPHAVRGALLHGAHRFAATRAAAWRSPTAPTWC